MKRTLLLAIALLAATSLGSMAQEGSFDGLYKSLPVPAAAPAAPVPAPAVAPAPAPAAREWLFLVFINGVNDLGLLGCADNNINAMEQVGSTDKVAVVVEYSRMISDPGSRDLRFQEGSDTLYVTRDADPNVITSRSFYSSPNADMGSAATLVRFVQRAVRRYPAKKVALVVWNHGAGRLGISFDDLTGDHMEVDELGRALLQVKGVLGHKIDVLATDACLMQMAAVAYELRDAADVVVGSEEIIPGDGYPYDKILGPLTGTPGMGAEELGTLIVDAYGRRYASNRVTLSALRAARTGALPGVLDAWVEAVRADPAAMKAAASRAVLDGTQRFNMRESRDLYDFVTNVDAALGPESRAVKDAGEVVKKYISDYLLIRSAAPNLPKAHGLAIYIPEQTYGSGNYSRLAFAADSRWDDFLLELLEARRKP